MKPKRKNGKLQRQGYKQLVKILMIKQKKKLRK